MSKNQLWTDATVVALSMFEGHRSLSTAGERVLVNTLIYKKKQSDCIISKEMEIFNTAGKLVHYQH